MNRYDALKASKRVLDQSEELAYLVRKELAKMQEAIQLGQKGLRLIATASEKLRAEVTSMGQRERDSRQAQQHIQTRLTDIKEHEQTSIARMSPMRAESETFWQSITAPTEPLLPAIPEEDMATMFEQVDERLIETMHTAQFPIESREAWLELAESEQFFAEALLAAIEEELQEKTPEPVQPAAPEVQRREREQPRHQEQKRTS